MEKDYGYVIPFIFFGGIFGIAEILQDSKTDINQRDFDEKTVLMKTVDGESNPDSSFKDPIHGQVFKQAVDNNDIDKIKQMVADGFNLNDVDSDGTPYFHYAVLHAAKYNQSLVVKHLLDMGADPNLQNKYGESSVHLIAKSDNIVVAKLLIDAGGDPEQINKNRMNAHDIAALAGHDAQSPIGKILSGEKTYDNQIKKEKNDTDLTQHSEELEKYGKNIKNIIKKVINGEGYINDQNNKYGFSYLHALAFYGGDVDEAQALIDRGIDIHLLDNSGKNAFEIAVLMKQFHIAKFLAENGTDTHLTYTDSKFNIVHELVTERNVKGIYFIGELGLDINVPDAQGATPLHWAISANDIEMIIALIENGADLYAPDNYGLTPMDFATLLPNAGEDIPRILDAAQKYKESKNYYNISDKTSKSSPRPVLRPDTISKIQETSNINKNQQVYSVQKDKIQQNLKRVAKSTSPRPVLRGKILFDVNVENPIAVIDEIDKNSVKERLEQIDQDATIFQG